MFACFLFNLLSKKDSTMYKSTINGIDHTNKMDINIPEVIKKE